MFLNIVSFIKHLSVLLSCALFFNLYAFDGSTLMNIWKSAKLDKIDSDSLQAWEAILEDGDILLKALVHKQTNTQLLKFFCHYHIDEMKCHGENHDFHATEDVTSNEMQKAQEVAFLKLEKTFSRMKTGDFAWKSVKVWKDHNNHEDGHEHGIDIWIHFVFELNNLKKNHSKEKNIYIQCHTHQSDEYFCHYKSKGRGETLFIKSPREHHDKNH